MAFCGRWGGAGRCTPRGDKKYIARRYRGTGGAAMSFRTKLFWVFLLTVLVTVSAVSYPVTHYSRSAFEDIERERTGTLVAQFRNEYAQRGAEIAGQLDYIVHSGMTVRSAIQLANT